MKFDVWKYIMSQSSYIKYQPYAVKGMLRGGGRNLNSWKKLRVEGSGWKLVRKISTGPRYGIDITGKDLLSLGELEGEVNSKKFEKWGICNLRTGDQILTKFDI